jgi:hypothetical protein
MPNTRSMPVTPSRAPGNHAIIIRSPISPRTEISSIRVSANAVLAAPSSGRSCASKHDVLNSLLVSDAG